MEKKVERRMGKHYLLLGKMSKPEEEKITANLIDVIFCLGVVSSTIKKTRKKINSYNQAFIISISEIKSW